MASGGDGDGGGREESASRVHPLVAGLIPGLVPIRRGRRVSGGAVLLLWIFLVGLAALRWERVTAGFSGPPGARIANATLVLCLLGAMTWSVREALRGTDESALERWGPGLDAFRRNRLAVGGTMAVLAFFLVALLTPLIAPFDPVVQGALVGGSNLPPSWEHPLGTDQYARDVLSRVLYGARISLSVGFVAVAISVTIGTLVGAVAGYVGGRTDALLMRFVDMVLSFPRLILLIAVIAVMESPSIFVIVAILGLTLWPSSARIVRGEVLALREREFVEAARALGFSGPRILGRHILPNALAPIIVAATLGIGNTIVLEAGLSFLGIGVQPPTPSWGNMVADGRTRLLEAWWISTFPGFAIVLTVLAFNLVGDGLRDALDPRQRGVDG